MGTDSAVCSLRQKQRQERLELILQTAEQVFTEKGYRDTSMDEIATRVGIGTATIYSHFSSKEDLMVVAILERDFRRIVPPVEEICHATGSATEKLGKVFHLLINTDFFSRRVQVLYAMGNSPEAQRAMLARQDAMLESAQAFSAALTTIIEHGKADGEFQPDIATATMLKGFLGMLRAQSVTDQFLNRYASEPDELLHIYLQGIARRE
ncbi:TetR/AcrR family transcriptional regulator [Ktedonosporobacter rubrisoli]|uniref:TetR/AcrR family transcriptional regulator n=1 Tax=Ktedonosporobacter rubrisoli TaxID=2509675 RepID=A0A4P6K6P8_KTERU|nr:TetR/AcrR family transcriptional regulator [Ktedonosporobacter rubrisoli]QBD83296.1 TetR/AcrR family transcriptional regulator [Ktedonosporobacter rubrisoli]